MCNHLEGLGTFFNSEVSARRPAGSIGPSHAVPRLVPVPSLSADCSLERLPEGLSGVPDLTGDLDLRYRYESFDGCLLGTAFIAGSFSSGTWVSIFERIGEGRTPGAFTLGGDVFTSPSKLYCYCWMLVYVCGSDTCTCSLRSARSLPLVALL